MWGKTFSSRNDSDRRDNVNVDVDLLLLLLLFYQQMHIQLL